MGWALFDELVRGNAGGALDKDTAQALCALIQLTGALRAVASITRKRYDNQHISVRCRYTHVECCRDGVVDLDDFDSEWELYAAAELSIGPCARRAEHSCATCIGAAGWIGHGAKGSSAATPSSSFCTTCSGGTGAVWSES